MSWLQYDDDYSVLNKGSSEPEAKAGLMFTSQLGPIRQGSSQAELIDAALNFLRAALREGGIEMDSAYVGG